MSGATYSLHGPPWTVSDRRRLATTGSAGAINPHRDFGKNFTPMSPSRSTPASFSPSFSPGHQLSNSVADLFLPSLASVPALSVENSLRYGVFLVAPSSAPVPILDMCIIPPPMLALYLLASV